MTAEDASALPADALAAEAPPPAVLSSLRLKATLSVFMALLVVALLAVTFALVSRLFDQLAPAVRADLEWKARRGAQDLAQAAELGIVLRDEKLILKQLGEYRTNADVLAIAVVDAGDLLLAVHRALPEPVAQLVSGPEGALVERDGYLVSWRSAVIEGARVGKVAVVISTARLREGIGFRHRVLLLAVLASLIALGLSLIFVNAYLGPLLRFAEATLADLRALNATLDGRVRERTRDLDEINGRLRDSLDRLHTTQQKLIEASRRSGMADVATAVLHNVGNVLNSVNVSAGVVSEGLRRARHEGVLKAGELLASHQQDLPGFFSTERGRQLPGYLCKLGESLAREQKGLLAELAQLQKNIDHIKAIVSLQQSHARSAVGATERFSPSGLLEDALRFNAASYARHGVIIDRDYAEVGPVTTDRNRLFQVVMNLLSNAKHAVREQAGERRIALRLRARPAERFAIEVADTGCGIAPENLVKIFNLGFTTKPKGHGFGLHSSAIAATELGGALTVHSEGPGKGATFTLELPIAQRGGP